MLWHDVEWAGKPYGILNKEAAKTDDKNDVQLCIPQIVFFSFIPVFRFEHMPNKIVLQKCDKTRKKTKKETQKIKNRRSSYENQCWCSYHS